MKMIHEYLERSVQFERMADEADDPSLRQQFLKQAAAYRKLAEKRAADLAKEGDQRRPNIVFKWRGT
jgi:hypothetical protein